MIVKISEIVTAMEMQGDMVTHYLNGETGKIVLVTDESEMFFDLKDPDSIGDLPDWQKEMANEAKDVSEFPDKYAELPDRYDINEYGIMQDFIEEEVPEKLHFHFYNAIQGSGAFGRFKEAVYHEGMKEAWYAFREDSLKKKAIEWCKENGLSYYEK